MQLDQYHGPALKLRPVLISLALVLVTALAAFVVGTASYHALGIGAIGAAASVSIVLGVLFGARPVEGITGFVIFALLTDTIEHWTAADLRYVDELTIPSLVLVTLVVHRRRLRVPRLGIREGALGVLIAAAVISSLVNAVPPTVWIPASGLLTKGFALFYVVLCLAFDDEEVSRIAGMVFIVGSIIIALGLIQAVAPQFADDVLRLPSVNQQRGEVQVVNSLFTHPALYGWLTVFLSLFLFARFAVTRRWWALGLALAFGVASIFSARRTPVVGLLVGVVVTALRERVSGAGILRTAASAGAIAVILAVVSLPLLGDFYRSTLREYGEPPEIIAEVFADDPDPYVISTLQPRVALYAGSLAIARDEFPLGAGLGRFGSHLSREQYSPLYAQYGLDRIVGLTPRTPIAVTDTFWPMILGEAGVIGLGAGGAFFGLLTRDLWRAAAQRPPATVHAFRLGALAVFVEALVRSLASPLFVAPPIAYFVFGAAALALSRRLPAIIDVDD
jgi:hypothetical protein